MENRTQKIDKSFVFVTASNLGLGSMLGLGFGVGLGSGLEFKSGLVSVKYVIKIEIGVLFSKIVEL